MTDRFLRLLTALLLAAWLALPAQATLCPADVDGDGEVSGADISMILLSFGPCGSPCPEDLDQDGFITSADLAMVFMQWGDCPRDLVTGVIRDRLTNAPLAGVTVFFYGSAYGSVTTDALGQYLIRNTDLVQFGGPVSGTLYIGKPGYLEAPLIAVTDLAQQPSLPVLADATLLPSGPLVQGRVTDATTGAGLAGAQVTYNRSPMSTWNGGATTMVVVADAHGDYAIDASCFNESGLTSGFTVNLRVNATGYLGAADAATFTATPWVRNFAMRSSAGPLMTGTVIDRATLDPIQGATVFFYGSGFGSVTTDASGSYTFTLADLNLFGGSIWGTLYIGKDSYFEALPISVSDLAQQPSLPVVADAMLTPGGSIVTGTVTSASTGNPIQGATILFSRNPPSTFLGGATTLSVTTDALGQYKIDASAFNESGLTGGFNIQLQANAPGFLGASSSASFSAWPIVRNFNLQ